MQKTKAKDYFIQNAIMLYDSREKENNEILRAFQSVGIKYERKIGNGVAFNFGDYSFYIDGKDYRTDIIFERKGSLNELFSNINDNNEDTIRHKNDDMRNNLEREFERMNIFQVREKWLMVEGVNNFSEIKNFKLDVKKQIPNENDSDYKEKMRKYNYFKALSQTAGIQIYSTLLSWQCSNRHNFKMFCSKSQYDIGVEMVTICYYFWRNEMKLKGLIEGTYYIGG